MPDHRDAPATYNLTASYMTAIQKTISGARIGTYAKPSNIDEWMVASINSSSVRRFVLRFTLENTFQNSHT